MANAKSFEAVAVSERDAVRRELVPTTNVAMRDGVWKLVGR